MAAVMMLFGAGAIGVVSYGTVAANVPSIGSPYSMTVALPLLDSWGLAAYMIWPMLFLLWAIQLFSRTPKIPIRSAVLMAVAWLLAAAWLLVHWQDGVIHQGQTHVAALLLVDLCFGAILLWILMRSRRNPTFGSSFAFHWLLFAWLAWGAAPWLGEGI